MVSMRAASSKHKNRRIFKAKMKKPSIILIVVCIILSCGRGIEKPETPINQSDKIFLELWEIFDDNYAFFELRGIDWKKEKEIFLGTNYVENDSMLFEGICSLLKQFDDTHINFESDSLNLYCNSGKVPDFLKEFPTNESFGLFLEARNNTLKQVGINQIVESDSKIFEYGKNEDEQWGYLRIKRFYGVGLEDMKKELDEIHQELGGVKNLIIDIRINPGGNDETALLCAGYFFEEKEIAFIKTVRNGKNHEDFSLPDTTHINPINSATISRTENIYLLTNGASGSSADVFALVMSYLPKTKIFGNNTEGIFSNMYRDTLSNGWRITLSNERYYSKKMKCYEKIGVPVDEVVNNRMEDVIKGVDLPIKKVIEKKPATNK